jgi:hypothetical protein
VFLGSVSLPSIKLCTPFRRTCGARRQVTDAAETTLLTGHRGGAITVWSLQNLPALEPRCSYRAHGGGVVAAVLFGGGGGGGLAPVAASCDLEGALHVWDTETVRAAECGGCTAFVFMNNRKSERLRACERSTSINSSCRRG